MLSTKRYHFKAAALPLALAIFLGIGSLYSCSENPPTQGNDTCDTCKVPCDTCDTTKPTPIDTTSHDFQWTQYSIPTESNLTGCWVFSDTEIYVIGSRLYMYDNGNWTRKPLPIRNTTREAYLADYPFFAFSKDDMWFTKGILYHYTNGFVDEYRNYSDSTFQGVVACWGTSSNDMFFVGIQGNISHFDGATFTKMASPTTKNLRSVWGTSHNDVWASGFDYTTAESVLLHYNGSIWTEQNLQEIGDIRPFKHGLGEVWATDSAGHKIVIASGSLLHRKTDNNPWRSDSGYVKNYVGGGSFIGLWHTNGNSINDFCIAGDGGFISHWNGKTWKRYDEVFNSGDPLYITNGMSMKGNTICMVGKRNGGSWIAIGRRK